MSTFGNACSDRGSLGQIDDWGATWIEYGSPSPYGGTVTALCAFIRQRKYGTHLEGYIYVIRESAGVFTEVGNSGWISFNDGSVTTVSGLNITIQAGDMVAMFAYTPGSSYDGDIELDTSGGNAYYVQSSTIGWPRNKTEFSNVPYVVSLGATYTEETADPNNIYVDRTKSTDGGSGASWASAKKYMHSGFALLNSGGILHTATGNYSADTTIAYNKSWKLSPEDPNSTGAKNVKIPKST